MTPWQAAAPYLAAARPSRPASLPPQPDGAARPGVALSGIPRQRGLRAWVAKLAVWLQCAAERSRGRRRLAEMDARMLRDIGISTTEREAEVRKWCWQV